jgi:chemotaxis protein histidine kinase CheA
MLHLVRNAVDHGIEESPERVRRGKSPEGLIRLSVSRQQDRVRLTFEDDGAGIDLERVRSKALAQGLLPSGAQPPTEAEILELIFLPGFSTREGVSEISGRGVGLDVVRSSVSALGGRVMVRSQAGLGTSFILDLPLTLAILHVLLVEVGGHLLAVPASRVQRALAVRTDQLFEVSGVRHLALGPLTLPHVDLLAALEQRPGPGAGARPEVMVLGDPDRPSLAVGVDHVAGHREVVLKSLGPTLRGLGPFAASTILGDGRPVLILDVDALLRRCGS